MSISDVKILKQRRRNETKVSATYFLEVSARVSLKVVTSGLFRGKKVLKS